LCKNKKVGMKNHPDDHKTPKENMLNFDQLKYDSV
jgi:hypothetical protein